MRKVKSFVRSYGKRFLALIDFYLSNWNVMCVVCVNKSKTKSKSIRCENHKMWLLLSTVITFGEAVIVQRYLSLAKMAGGFFIHKWRQTKARQKWKFQNYSPNYSPSRSSHFHFHLTWFMEPLIVIFAWDNYSRDNYSPIECWCEINRFK